MNNERIKEIEAQYIEYLNTYKVNDNIIDYNAQTKMDRLHNIFLKMLEEKNIIENSKINNQIKSQIRKSKKEKIQQLNYHFNHNIYTGTSNNNIETWISEEHVKALAQKYKVTNL
ncbi:MAG TPA: hypothetical protein GX708_08320 [Gallicola sp.]|nr:hypothetical protein [Gallicola sp.]